MEGGIHRKSSRWMTCKENKQEKRTTLVGSVPKTYLGWSAETQANTTIETGFLLEIIWFAADHWNSELFTIGTLSLLSSPQNVATSSR